MRFLIAFSFIIIALLGIIMGTGLRAIIYEECQDIFILEICVEKK